MNEATYLQRHIRLKQQGVKSHTRRVEIISREANLIERRSTSVFALITKAQRAKLCDPRYPGSFSLHELIAAPSSNRQPEQEHS